jgi:hypothetical protein
VAITADRIVIQKETGKKQQYKRMYRDKTKVEHEMYDYTGNNWSHRNSNTRFKEKSGSHTRKTFNGFNTKDSCNWNVTPSVGSTAV